MISIETASWWYDKANLGLIISLAVGVISTLIVVWTGNIKEEHLKNTIAKANVVAAQSFEKATEAQKRLAEAEQKTAQLELDLERERSARLPRSIQSNQKVKLLDLLKSAPKGTVFVATKQFDEEANQYAKQILDILKEAGFDAKEKNGPMSFGIPGTWIMIKEFKHPPGHAVPLQAAFKQVGIDLDGQEQKEQVPDLNSVLICIGAKP